MPPPLPEECRPSFSGVRKPLPGGICPLFLKAPKRCGKAGNDAKPSDTLPSSELSTLPPPPLLLPLQSSSRAETSITAQPHPDMGLLLMDSWLHRSGWRAPTPPAHPLSDAAGQLPLAEVVALPLADVGGVAPSEEVGVLPLSVRVPGCSYVSEQKPLGLLADGPSKRVGRGSDLTSPSEAGGWTAASRVKTLSVATILG